jgi:hypothetical protein
MQNEPDMEIRWRDVVRDIVIVFVLTAVGGFIVGVTGVTAGRRMIAAAASNLLLGTVAFTIVGCLHESRRVVHTCTAALGNWILGLGLVAAGAATVLQWTMSVVPMLLTAALGAFLAQFFTRPRSTAESRQ